MDLYYRIQDKPTRKRPTLLKFVAAYVYLVNNEPFLRNY